MDVRRWSRCNIISRWHIIRRLEVEIVFICGGSEEGYFVHIICYQKFCAHLMSAEKLAWIMRGYSMREYRRDESECFII